MDPALRFFRWLLIGTGFTVPILLTVHTAGWYMGREGTPYVGTLPGPIIAAAMWLGLLTWCRFQIRKISKPKPDSDKDG